MEYKKRVLVALLVILSSLFMVSCGITRSAHQATSVVQYLYPENKQIVETTAAPGTLRLTLPLRVGIAFVPPSPDGTPRSPQVQRLGEKDKMDLMKQISAEFKQYPFVKSLEIIPSPYLMPKGGFANLDQIRTMYGIDVIALISYDQIQHTDEGLLSLSYWTLIGAYIVKGEKNDTSTMLDAAVYHIPDRKLLFRAPGTSQVKGAATPVNLSEQLRKDSQDGFQKAAVVLVENLKEQLEQFKEKVKEQPKEYKVEYSSGYRGGGSLHPLSLVLLAVMGGVLLWKSSRGRD